MAGIVIDETNDTVIRDNLPANNRHAGIYIGTETWNNRIVGNEVTGNGGVGIALAGHPTGDNDTIVRRNDIRDNAAGIIIRGNGGNISIVSNRIENTTGDGIIVEGNATLTDNLILDSRQSGVAIRNVRGALIRNTTVRRAAEAGIVVEMGAKDNRLESNRVEESTVGLLVTRDVGRTTVSGLEIIFPGEVGVILEGSGENEITGLHVRGGEVIQVRSAKNQVTTVTPATSTPTNNRRVGGDPSVQSPGASDRTRPGSAGPAGTMYPVNPSPIVDVRMGQ